MCDSGVTQDPPRKTIWLHMNLPLYSPNAPSLSSKAGIGGVRATGPLPNITKHLTRRARCIVRLERYRMKVIALAKISVDRQRRGNGLPSTLARQPATHPAGKGVGFVVADVADWLARVDISHATERHDLPAIIVELPVKRCIPPALLNHAPRIGEP